MKSLKSTLLFGVVFLVLSFKPPLDNDNMLIGVWVYSHSYSEDKLEIYKRRDKFDEDNRGLEFKEDGELIKRRNVGFCGTPPIEHGNYMGSWKRTSDSTITITDRRRYGKRIWEEDYWIEEVNEKKLVMKLLDYRYEEVNEGPYYENRMHE